MESRFCPRTILVIIYVVAVALILVYQTVQPPPIPAPTPPGGRYQLESVGASEPFLLDTLTGDLYGGYFGWSSVLEEGRRADCTVR
jgi:hypothetical protein